MSSSVFRRRISPTEQLYLSAREVHPPFLIQVVVEGAGALDAARLQQAVDLASRVHPGARLVRSGKDWVAGAVTPRVRVANAAIDYDHLTDDSILNTPIARPDYVSEAPNCEVVLLTADPVTVIFRAFHGVMDAKGLQMWATDVFRALRGAEPEGASHATTDLDLAVRLGIPGSPVPMRLRFRAPVGHGADIAERPFLLRHRTVRGTASSAVARISEIVTTVNGSRSRIMVPVDLRRHDGALRSTANLTLPLFLDITPGESWQEINARMLAGLMRRDELNQMKQPGLELIPVPIAKRIIRGIETLGRRTGRNLCSAIISHAGKVAIADFAAPDFTPTAVVALPAHTGLAPISFAIVESEQTIGITVSCRNGRGVAERLESLLDAIVVALGEPEPGASTMVAATAEVDQLESERPAGTPLTTTAEQSHSVPARQAATLVQVLREQAAIRPEGLAVTGPDGALTYAQLGARSAAIAARLREYGVRRGDIVAILSGRTLAGMAGQWGILEAGAAFLPLDPKHPRERIAQTLSDSGTRICLVARRHADLVGDTVPVLTLEDLPESGAEAVDVAVLPTDVAYVTYTSGSTGRPKGVKVTHDGVVHYLRAALDWYQLTPETRFAHYHTPAADMACMAMVSPAVAGGAVLLAPGEINHLTLADMLGENGADTLFFTPSLAEVALRQGIAPSGVRTVVLGGEQLSLDLARRVREFFGPTVRLVNSYGPTEVSLVCTSHILSDHTSPGAASTPIGVPSPGTTVHLLNSAGQSVSDGEVGELYLGGPQVAAGYIDRPELTAARFVTVRGERTYRTGDLVRRLPDGTLEFIGRIDHQVKIRGNRVEPDEIRCVLESHPDIAAACVVSRRRAEHSDHVLDAFVVPAPTTPAGHLDDSALRDFLAARLPVYMIPSSFHRLAELPLTSNGKTDRAALVELRAAEVVDESDVNSSSPLANDTGAEVREQVAAIWARVLRCDSTDLAADSDFFALGGDSLATVEMLAQVSRQIVGTASEQAFVAQVEGLIHHLTLNRVCEAVAVAAGAGEER
ncbi:non-ribosomal peptide synthetase [Nocardia uniformis]|uniref:Non-ribosomal peptide synthetase n=1 Tax=Nocardia uniformis TaxID=53432 RepID=A0A849BXH2_9NOCA|nr:non-ribosomal peptide synthetase [Nocardia uniformis]NNH68980.1 non-ribosomal peptide synthetase [Nocardia uniformis]